jgi:GLPGLI family protein
MQGFFYVLLAWISIYNKYNMRYLLTLLLLISLSAQAQTKPKVVTECTVDFIVSLGADSNTENIQKASSLVLYIKGQQSRLDFISPSFKQVKYYDGKTKSAVVLQDLGATKVRRDLDSVKWNKLNEKYDDSRVSYTDEKKTILGYECKKANITLKNGSTYSLFYAVEIIPSTRDYEFQFRGIPGFVLEYEAAGEGANQKVTYTATKINLSPVSPTKFEIPKAGYRVL